MRMEKQRHDRREKILLDNPRGKGRTRRLIWTGLALVLFACAGCPVLQWEQSRLERGLNRSGFVHDRLPLSQGQLDFWMGGAGAPVVLIHGFGASAIWQWESLARKLSSDHRVIFPDLLWFGGSFSAEEDFSIDHQVRAVLELMDFLKIDRFDLVGLSYGGLVAYELASAHPERVGRVVLSDTPAREYTEADYSALCRRFDVDHISQVLLPETAQDVQRLLELAYWAPPWTPRFVRRETVHALYGSCRDQKRGLLDWMIESVRSSSARPHTYRARTLLVWGEEDPVFPLEIGQRLARRLGARLEVISRARHAPQLEHPSRFYRLVRSFLARERSGGR